MINTGGSTQTKKVAKTKRKVRNVRPEGFNDTQKLVRSILEGEGVGYNVWLHELHLKKIHDFNMANISEISKLAKGDE